MSAGRSAALAALLALLGCGREDVLLTDLPIDAGTVEAGPVLVGTDGSVGACNPTPHVCRPLGATCSTTGDCCSARCEGGTCLPISACEPKASACSAPVDCCSGRCEPVPGTTNRACTAICQANGAACTTGRVCCSLSCEAGTCASTACHTIGDDCTGASQCCSSTCTAGKCAADAVALCRPSGEDCTKGGGVPCCYGCVNGRCDLGSGVCRPRGAPCGVDADCCEGACTLDANKNSFCAAACVANGVQCKESADCCSGGCSSSAGVCIAASTCALVGSVCKADGDCCTGTCLAGGCADTCPSPVR